MPAKLRPVDKTVLTWDQLVAALDRLLEESLRDWIPRVSTFNHIEGDMFGEETGGRRFPGPLGNPAAKSVWMVDPRRDRSVDGR